MSEILLSFLALKIARDLQRFVLSSCYTYSPCPTTVLERSISDLDSAILWTSSLRLSLGKVKVYIDDDGVIFDASLNQTNIGGNNNKFYRLQLLFNEKEDEYYTHTRWGRVGEYGQAKTMGPISLDGALKEYNKKFKDKSGHSWTDRSEPAKKGKYTFLERNYEDDEEDAAENVKKEEDEEREQEVAESKLPRQTQRLMELIFNQNHFNAVLEGIGYNANKLPLGKLSKATLKQGFEHLHELASLIKHPTLAQNKYQTSEAEVSTLSPFQAYI